MKKKSLLILPLLVTILAACNGYQDSSTSASSSNQTSSSEVEPSSVESSSDTSSSSGTSSTSSAPQTIFQKDGFTFNLNEETDQLVLVAYESSGEVELTIPSEVDGHLVTEISQSFAMQVNTTVNKLTIPDTINKIGLGALKSFTSIQELITPLIAADNNDTSSAFGYLFGNASYILQQNYIPASLKKLTVTQGVINEYAFYSLDLIEEFSFGGTSIGNNAFNGSRSLKKVEFIGNSLTSIGDYAFYNCQKLTDFALPDTLENLGKYALDGINIETLNIPASLNTFTFTNSISTLKEITVSEGNTSFKAVDGILFSYDLGTIVCYPAAKDGTTYSVPDNVTKIGDRAFMRAENLETIALGNVKTIGSEGFRYSSLVSVTLPSSIEEIGKTAFSACGSLESFTFPDQVSVNEVLINEFLLSSCPKLTSITFPNYIKNIPNYCVSNCEKLAEIVIEGEIVSIGQNAFSSTAITSLEITFADNATIGERIFVNCPNFQEFVVHFVDNITTYPTLEGQKFGEAIPIIKVDDQATLDALKAAWPEYSSYIVLSDTQSDIFLIEDGVLLDFLGGPEDTEIVIPDTVVEIADHFLENNQTVKHVTIPETVTEIGYRAFSGCDALLSVTFEDETLANLTLKTSKGEAGTVTDVFNSSVPVYIFKSSTSITNFLTLCTNNRQKKLCYLEDEVTREEDEIVSINGDALIRASGKENYSFKDGITIVGPYAFYNSSVSNVDFSQISRIEEYAFNGSAITEAILPESVTYVGDSAFQSCEELTTVEILGPAVIKSTAFADGGNISSLNLGEQIVSIESGAFTNATDGSIEYVVLPSSLVNVAEGAFEDSSIPECRCKFSQQYAEDTFSDGSYFADMFDNVIWDYTE